MGIHYDYKSTRGAKAMEKQAKREKKLAEKRAKTQSTTANDTRLNRKDLFSYFGAMIRTAWCDPITRAQNCSAFEMNIFSSLQTKSWCAS